MQNFIYFCCTQVNAFKYAHFCARLSAFQCQLQITDEQVLGSQTFKPQVS